MRTHQQIGLIDREKHIITQDIHTKKGLCHENDAVLFIFYPFFIPFFCLCDNKYVPLFAFVPHPQKHRRNKKAIKLNQGKYG